MGAIAAALVECAGIRGYAAVGVLAAVECASVALLTGQNNGHIIRAYCYGVPTAEATSTFLPRLTSCPLAAGQLHASPLNRIVLHQSPK